MECLKYIHITAADRKDTSATAIVSKPEPLTTSLSLVMEGRCDERFSDLSTIIWANEQCRISVHAPSACEKAPGVAHAGAARRTTWNCTERQGALIRDIR